MKVKKKPKKALQARFKKTAKGKLLRNKQGRRHILSKKRSKKKRQLKNPALVSDAFSDKYKKLMGAA